VIDHPKVPLYLSDLAAGHHALGKLEEKRNRPEEALRRAERACQIQQKLVDAQPTVPQYRHELASYHHRVGLLYQNRNENEASLRHYLRCRELSERLTREHGDIPVYRLYLAFALDGEAVIRERQGQLPQALDLCRQAVAHAKQVL